MDKSQFLLVLLLSLTFSVNFLIQAQDYQDSQNVAINNDTNSTNSSVIDIYDPTKCPPKFLKNQEDFQICCQNLNMKRHPFGNCCKYPQLIIWLWQYQACQKKIAAQGQKIQRCNMLSCCYEYMGVIDDTVTTTGIKPEGLMYSFFLSSGNNTLWIDPLKESVGNCYGWLVESVPDKSDNALYNKFWDCYETIPMYLNSIIQCSYDYNYLLCPAGVWNETLFGCEFTRNYVANCIIGLS